MNSVNDLVLFSISVAYVNSIHDSVWRVGAGIAQWLERRTRD